MDHGMCTVIYLDKRADDQHVRRDSIASSTAGRTSTGSYIPGYFNGYNKVAAEVQANIETILTVFPEVHVCGSGTSCLSKISDLDASVRERAPIIVLIDLPYDEEQRMKRLSKEPRASSPMSLDRRDTGRGPLGDIYGMHLLTHMASEIQQESLSKLVIPVVILSGLDRDWTVNGLPSPSLHGSHVMADTVRVVRYLDAGAVDVLTSPVSRDRVYGLAAHAYHRSKEYSRERSVFLSAKRNRKLSWVGVEEAKPYSYLREAMVSGLMHGICNPEEITDTTIDPTDVEVTVERQNHVAEAVGKWNFSAHDFTEDELLWGALLMLQHALKMPELKRWRMDTDRIIEFLLASRTAYNSFVLYHNFRHVVDVLQAVFYFLVQIGSLPPYPPSSSHPSTPQAPLAKVLKPFDALTLLIAAIGHDVGHPGVNNAFLVALNAPLAQLYNDRSVLESFHCAAYSQILRRYWPSTFSDVAMRRLMINTILATDMGLHFQYMSNMKLLNNQINGSEGEMASWESKQVEDARDSLCGLLIKCADISNVARQFQIAARWASILNDEFSNQGEMEQILQMKTCLFGGPPVLDDLVKMGQGQITFMTIFAKPLFQGMTEMLPAMHFSVDEISNNMSTWDRKVADEEARRSAPAIVTTTTEADISLSGTTSRRTSAGSPAVATGASASSRRSSLGLSPTSSHTPRLSTENKPNYEHQVDSINNVDLRRDSDVGSVTAIVVTETPPTPSSPEHEATCLPRLRSRSPAKNSDATTNGSPKKVDSAHPQRPLTAPSPLRSRASTKDMDAYAQLRPVQSDMDSANFLNSPLAPSASESDLAQKANGMAGGDRDDRHWTTDKQSYESRPSERDEGALGWKGYRANEERGWKNSTWRRNNNPGAGEDARKFKGDKAKIAHPDPSSGMHTMNDKTKASRFGFRRLFGKKDRKVSNEVVENDMESNLGRQVPVRQGD